MAALRDLEFEISDNIEHKIIAGVDFVQLKDGPFDLDLVFAPDGIESFEKAKERMYLIDVFPVANIRDIISSKRASGREKDLVDLPLLEDFQEEFEKKIIAEGRRMIMNASELTFVGYKAQDDIIRDMLQGVKKIKDFIKNFQKSD